MSISFYVNFSDVAYHIYLYNHVVVYENVFTRGKFLKVLGNKHIINEIHIIVLGNVENCFFYKVGTISKNVKASVKARVLRIVRSKSYFAASLPFYV